LDRIFIGIFKRNDEFGFVELCNRKAVDVISIDPFHHLVSPLMKGKSKITVP